MKQCVLEEVRLLVPEETVEFPSKKGKAFFACQRPSLIEEEISTCTTLAMQDEDPLIFWKTSQKANLFFF
uniref:Uncharacterized protein n=1 Tax=Ditylenchus dipsaci TaxID=166011 RepID=A0A915DU27_9BILA